MQKPLNLKLRKGDKVATMGLMGYNPNTTSLFLVVTEMGYFYKMDYKTGAESVEEIWAEVDAD